MKTKQDKTLYFPCQSLSCPKHTMRVRQQWATRIESEIGRANYSYTGNLPINEWIDAKVLQAVWRSTRDGIEYEYGKFCYCVSFEVQEHKPHLHFVFSNDKPMDQAMIKSIWYKYLTKKTDIKRTGLSSFIRPVDNPVIDANYCVNAYGSKQNIQLPPKGYKRRLIWASIGYGKD